MSVLLTLWFLTASFAWLPPISGVPLGYTMYRQVQGQPRIMIAVIDASDQEWQDPAPAPGRQCYDLTAQDAQGEGPASNRVCIRCQGKKCR